MDPRTAGYETVEEYKRVIDSLISCTFRAEINIPESRYVRDFDSSNFVQAFPRHFPYGYGGPEEQRILQKEGNIGHVSTDKYISQVTNLSNLHFHEHLFILVCFNLYHRQKMVDSACWRVWSKEGRDQRLSDLTPDKVVNEIQIRNKQRNRSDVRDRDASEFLGQINAISKALPHTNDVAKKGRKDVLAMQINYGFPDIFFTISPPDDNSFIITVYSGIKELPRDVNNLTQEELTRLAKQRDNLRFKYPGISTFNFERILSVVMKEIVGWKNQLGGFFGKPKAYFHSVEEQARKTLHVHMLLWIDDLPYRKDDLHLHSKPVTNLIKRNLAKVKNYVNQVQSCNLIGNKGPRHNCIGGKVVVKSDQELRFLRHKEGCRTLRCAMSYCVKCDKEWTSDELALCHLISKRRKSDPLYASVIRDGSVSEQDIITNRRKSVPLYASVVGDESVSEEDEITKRCKSDPLYASVIRDGSVSEPDIISKRRKSNPLYASVMGDGSVREQDVITKRRKSVPLDASVIIDGSISEKVNGSESLTVCKKGFLTILKEKTRLAKCFLSEVIYQSKLPGPNADVGDEVNVNYNIHSTSHVRTCFGSKCPECRYKFPKKSNKRTRIDIPEDEQDWFSYTGVCCKRRIIEILPERGSLDVCMNNYCPMVSETKLACNSNVSVIVNGVQAFYVTKYTSKNTQEQDSSEYENVIRYVEKRLLSSKFPDNTGSESMSRLIGACLAHNSKNVISATLAKYLINNSSRFAMSHTIFYIPLYEMKRVLDSEQIMLKISTTTVPGQTLCHFLEGSSLHYLYRPDELESVSLLDFIVNYEVRRQKRCHDPEDIMYFKEGHPAQEYQHITERTNMVIPGINNWEFIDTSRFGGDLLDPHVGTDQQAEDYAKTVLILCIPFRTKEDLMHQGSYVSKFRLLWKVIFLKCGTLLQNIQDIRNAVRCKCRKDLLETVTEAFRSESNENDSEDEAELDEKERQYLDGLFSSMTSFDNNYVSQNNINQIDNDPSLTLPPSFSLRELQNKGAHKCGYQNLCDFTYSGDDPKLIDIEEEQEPENSLLNSSERNREYPKLTIESMYEVLITTVRRKVHESSSVPESLNESISESDEGSVNLVQSVMKIKLEATGTVESMKLRAKHAHFDKNQRKAFLMMLSHFVLSYIEEIEDHCQNSTLRNTKHYSTIRQEKQKLMLSGGKLIKLRLFLDGAGGSGKSEVLKEMLRYARDFCEKLQVPFTKYTILMTASTGVAATLINGNTVHSACSVYKYTTDQDREEFKDVRLLVLDEISMIDIKFLKKRDGKLRDLRELGEFYGGINVVFVGDFRQLDPVNANPIYKDLLAPEWMHAVNSYVELHGMYRFADDVLWGECLKRFRDGVPLPSDFHSINDRVVQSNGRTRDEDDIPEHISYATPRNKERDAINAGIFSKIIQTRPEQALVIFSDKLGIKKKGDSKYTPVTNCFFWEECGESDCVFKGRTTRMDPVLKLYSDCPVMLTENFDVDNRMANGTQGLLVKVVLKSGQSTSKILIDGVLVQAVFASKISYIRLRHLPKDGKRGTEFKIEPKQHSGFSVSMPRPVELQGKIKTTKMTFTANQIPVVVNNATTGHKLQGCTKSSVFINCFSYAKNWPYVVLSRVKTRKGLYLGRPLDESKDYSIDVKLLRMKEVFSSSKQIPDSYFE